MMDDTSDTLMKDHSTKVYLDPRKISALKALLQQVLLPTKLPPLAFVVVRRHTAVFVVFLRQLAVRVQRVKSRHAVESWNGRSRATDFLRKL